MAKKKSKMGSINFNDVVKGLLIAVSASVLAAAQQMLLTKPPQLDFKQIGIVALISAIAYLGKQFTQNSEGDLFTKETKKETDENGN